MMDWNGTVNFVLDALDRITSINDQNAKVNSYTYGYHGVGTNLAPSAQVNGGGGNLNKTKIGRAHV
jgi:hypothetical protein